VVESDTNVRQLRTPMVNTGLVSTSDVDRSLELTSDPRFVAWTASLVSTWGRRPLPDEATTEGQEGST